MARTMNRCRSFVGAPSPQTQCTAVFSSQTTGADGHAGHGRPQDTMPSIHFARWDGFIVGLESSYTAIYLPSLRKHGARKSIQ
jgi:hypothetical protein